MSGFAGMAGRGNPQRVREMLAALALREPTKDEGFGVADAYFAQRRCAGTSASPEQHIQLLPSGQGQEALFLWDGELYPGGPTPGDVPALLAAEGSQALKRLSGAFAFALYLPETRELILGRDPLGIRPLYYGFDSDGTLYFASQMKGVLAATPHVQVFPPGHVYHTSRGWEAYYQLQRPSGDAIADAPAAVARLTELLREAVRGVLQGERPTGAFLSGGLDSSLICALAVEAKGPLPTFAVGVPGSRDLLAAREVADYLKTRHYEYEIKGREVEAALPEVVRILESFDPALVRGAMATYFTSRLASEHVEAVLTGEGADELFAGYAYLKSLRSPEELEQELLLITRTLHQTGLQRVDRLTRYHGLTARLPFLHRPVVEYALALDPALKIRGSDQVEKWIVREVARPYLPETITARRKEKFAIGTGIADLLRDWAADQVTDQDFHRHRMLPGGFEIKSKEELFYYRIFREWFPQEAAIRAIGRSRSLDPGQRYA